MRTMIDREEETTDSEVTLSAATLLGIFFGLVLICGVFFGFGYSIGRRGTESTAKQPSTTDSEPSEPTAPAAQPTAPKPSAMQTLQTASTDSSAADDSSNTVTQPLDESSAAPARPAPAAVSATQPAPKVVRAVATQPATQTLTSASLPVAPASTPASAPAVGSSAVMVQIAAVSHQEDADALIAALRKHGYSVSARNEPQDKLLHVQVGPFASRDAARAMRAKLAADGYNAILK